MPLPLEDDLPEPTDQPTEPDTPTKPHIAEWVEELPRPRRTTDFDPVIDQIRQQTPGQWARLQSGNGKPISANKCSTLKKRYPDVEIKQVSGETYAALKQA